MAFLEKKGRQLSCRFYHCSTKWNSLKQFMRKYFSVDKHEVVIFVKRERKFLLVSMAGCVSLYCREIGASDLEMATFKLKNFKQ